MDADDWDKNSFSDGEVPTFDAGSGKFIGSSGGSIDTSTLVHKVGDTMTGELITPKLTLPVTATASPNFGTLSIGPSPFDGATPGFYAGNSAGTYFAINTANSFAGDIFHIQKFGETKYKFSANGMLQLGKIDTSDIDLTTSEFAAGISNGYASLMFGNEDNLSEFVIFNNIIPKTGGGYYLTSDAVAAANSGMFIYTYGNTLSFHTTEVTTPGQLLNVGGDFSLPLIVAGTSYGGINAGVSVCKVKDSVGPILTVTDWVLSPTLFYIDYTGRVGANKQIMAQHLGSSVNDNTQDAIRIQPSSALSANYRGLTQYLNSTDTSPTFTLNKDGKLEWGVGGSSALDTSFQRSAAGALRINSKLGIGGNAISSLTVPIAPTVNANYGLLSLGAGPFDGSTTGFFVGDATASGGTHIAVNAVTGFAGNFVDLQVAGVRKFSVSNAGDISVGNNVIVASGGKIQFGSSGFATPDINISRLAATRLGIDAQTKFTALGSSVNDSTQDTVRIQPSTTLAANYRGLAVYPTSAATTPTVYTDSAGAIQVVAASTWNGVAPYLNLTGSMTSGSNAGAACLIRATLDASNNNNGYCYAINGKISAAPNATTLCAGVMGTNLLNVGSKTQVAVYGLTGAINNPSSTSKLYGAIFGAGSNNATGAHVIGVLGHTRSGATISYGGYFTFYDSGVLEGTLPTVGGSGSAALAADNAAIAADIFRALDNGTTVVSIADGGQTRLSMLGSASDDVTQDALRIQPSGALLTYWRGLALYNASGGTVPNYSIDKNVVVFMGNSPAVPGANPTNGGYLYVEAGALKYRGSGGTVTTIAPA